MLPENIAALLDRFRNAEAEPLTDAELAELRTGLRAAGHSIHAGAADSGGLTDENVETLRDLATTVGQITTEETTRAETQATRAAAADEALAALGTDPDPEPVGDPTLADPVADGSDPAATVTDPAAAPAAPAAVTDPAPVEPVVEVTADPVAVAAAATPPPRPTPGQAARRIAPGLAPARRPDPTPVRDPHAARVTIVAAGGATDVPSGTLLDDVGAISEPLLTAYSRMGTPGRAVIASIRTEYPEDRRLRRGQPEENGRKIDAALLENQVASGGICGPVAVDYTIPNWSVQDRPIKGGLPGFQADRGGLTFVQPPALSDFEDATEVWTEATDATPGTATKPVHTVVCGDTETVYVDAIPTRLKMGNMQGRYFPEQITLNTAKALSQAARDAETNLWDKLIASSTIAHAPQYLGATRDLLAYVELAVAGLKDDERMSDGQRVRMLIHRTFRSMLKADLAREIGHQQGEVNSFAITDAQIDDWLDAHGVTPIWAMDSPTPATIHSVAIVAQGIATQSAGAVLADWPASCAFTIWPEGAYQFLDGGRLDLGIVRDSVLDSTNDYETFVEPFESVAFRGVRATTVVVPLVPNGGSAGTVSPAEPSE